MGRRQREARGAARSLARLAVWIAVLLAACGPAQAVVPTPAVTPGAAPAAPASPTVRATPTRTAAPPTVSVMPRATAEALTPLDRVLDELRTGPRFRRPTPQDEEGRGIFPLPGIPEARSEPVYSPFVLGPRRQTDSLVRQLYLLLPTDVRRSTAFLIPDRVAQQPDAYLDYIRSRPRAVIIGNFVGIGDAPGDRAWFLRRHRDELRIGRQTIQLAQALGAEVVAVRYTMGDSLSPHAATVRERLQGELDAALAELGLAHLRRPISWGADEGVAVAFADQLPPRTVRVTYATRTARHVYDGNQTTPEVVAPKLAELGLVPVDGDADIEALILTNVTGDDGSFPDAAAQRQLDEQVLAPVLADAGRRAQTAIVDARMFNGALDARSAPPHCDVLAYGSWGTLANKVGLTLATAKILVVAGRPEAQRQLYLEAVAHDVYANGYRDGRDGFAPLLAAEGVTFDHFDGYASPAQVGRVFRVLNGYVNRELAAHFAGTGCLAGRSVRLTPQLWRTFESEAHLLPLSPGELDVVGVYRTDLDPAVFDPTHATGLRSLTLDDLTREAAP